MNTLNLGDKNYYVHDAAKSHRTDTNYILECNMINDANSIGLKQIKREKVLLWDLITNEQYVNQRNDSDCDRGWSRYSRIVMWISRDKKH